MSKFTATNKIFTSKNAFRSILLLSLTWLVILVISLVRAGGGDRDSALPLPISLNLEQSGVENSRPLEIEADLEGDYFDPEEVSVELDPTPPPPPVAVRTTTAPSAASRSQTRTVVNNPAPPSVEGNTVLEIAANYVGVPYLYGGNDPATGLDCSGFTKLVYGQLGITLPRSSGAQKDAGTVVSAADALPGDLVWTPGHIAIYAGDGMIIDAPSPGKTIQFRKMYQKNPTFVRVS